MTTDTHALEALLERIRQAEGPDRELDEAVFRTLGYEIREDGLLRDSEILWTLIPAVSASLDACANLQAEALPGWVRLTVSNDSTGLVEVTLFQTDDPRAHVGDTNESECLAWLAAILSAVLAKAKAEVAGCLPLKPERPIEELESGNAFRESIVPKADWTDPLGPLWRGWAVMEAFLAGIDYARRAPDTGETP